MILIDQIRDFERRLNALHYHLKIDDKISLVNAEELKTQENNFWDDPKVAELIMKRIKKEKSWIDGYNKAKHSIDDLLAMYEFFLEDEVSEEELQINIDVAKNMLEDIEFKNMLSSDEDNMPAILTINPGAGGTESQDWASMLMRMYTMWGGLL